jgi:hypothetical protein
VYECHVVCYFHIYAQVSIINFYWFVLVVTNVTQLGVGYITVGLFKREIETPHFLDVPH